jgi:anhydro-N-acetylmuramic acid kinase
MTGTSCDGLDAACLEIDVEGWERLWSFSAPFPASLRSRVLAIQKAGTQVTLKELLLLQRDLGNWHGKTIDLAIRRNAKHGKPDLIADHGQTVAHHPDDGTTLQLGEPTRIAHATGITVATQFREGDMAAGGQGAPLAPLYHRFLAGRLDPDGEGVAIHNVGGISNLTYVGPDGQVLAFDTGPGNIWIDAAAEAASLGKLKIDRDGLLASRGRADVPALKRLLKHPYFGKAAPKSTGRDDFPFTLFRKATKAKGPDLVATATALTVESIARAYERFILGRGMPLKRVFLCGGGARNPVIAGSLQARLPDLEIHDLDEAGLDARYAEAEAFALFGFMSALGMPLGGSWTGVRGFGPPAHLIPGENWDHVLEKIAELRK